MIQIANIVKVQGSDDIVAKNVFTLGSCTPIVGAHVITNINEDDLLWEVRWWPLLSVTSCANVAVDCNPVYVVRTNRYRICDCLMPFLLRSGANLSRSSTQTF